MDRFIVLPVWIIIARVAYLKSSMDRFIEAQNCCKFIKLSI